MSKTADAISRHWTDALPEALRPYAQLSRLDRPIGWRLLLLPCLMGMAIARQVDGFFLADAAMAALFFVGAVAMRGAGCTWNDLLDRDIDGKVARTAGRPLPSGRISARAAVLWLLAQLCVGFVVWLGLAGPAAFANIPLSFAQLVAICSLPLVAVYPLMKRITWWPQVWLGLVFSWGTLVAGAVIHHTLQPEILLLYAGCVAWTIAYDTIYALQDREDDALIGVRSTALRFGRAWRGWVLGFYALALFFWASALYIANAQIWSGAAMAAVGAFAILPMIDAIDESNPAGALIAFRRNGAIGWLVVAVCAALPTWITLGPFLR